MNTISGRTRVVSVIGDPIGHSLSPAMHNAAFRHLGLDFVYVPFHVPPAKLKAAVAGFRALEIVGVNVTVPHKETILRLLDSVSPVARRVGAVNTVINRDGHLHGENTDVYGFRQALADARVELRGTRAVVIGAGGAARAVLVALAEGRAAEIRIANRTLARARGLARAFRTRSTTTTVLGLPQLQRADLGDVDLIVNTTPVGLETPQLVGVAYASTPKEAVFFDLISRSQTAFLRAATRARRRTVDGTGMLLHQGAAAFTLWTGQPAPIDVMRRALKAALGK